MTLAERVKALQTIQQLRDATLPGAERGARHLLAFLETMMQVLDEFERLVIVAPGDSPLDDGPQAPRDDQQQLEVVAEFLSGLDVAIAGMHAYLCNAATCFESHRQGRRLSVREYEAARDRATDLARELQAHRAKLGRLAGGIANGIDGRA